jgi:hypothetical protein
MSKQSKPVNCSVPPERLVTITFRQARHCLTNDPEVAKKIRHMLHRGRQMVLKATTLAEKNKACAARDALSIKIVVAR